MKKHSLFPIFRRSVFVPSLAPLVCLSIAVAQLNSYPHFSTWPNLVEALLKSCYFSCPLLAGLAAWDSYRYLKNDGGEVERLASRAPFTPVLGHIGSSTTYAAFVWLAVATSLFLRGMILGLYGGPNPLVILYSLFLVCVWTATGTLLPRIIPGWFSIPVAVAVPLAIYSASFLSFKNFDLSGNNVFAKFTSSDDSQLNTWYFLGLLLMVTAVIALYFSIWRIRALQNATWTVVAGVTALALFAAGNTFTASQNYRSYSLDENPPLSLVSDASDAELKIYAVESYEAIAPELVSRWKRVQRLVHGSGLQFDTLTQQATNDHGAAPETFQRLYLDPATADPYTDSIASSLLDIAGCLNGKIEQPTGDFGVEGHAIVGSWLMGTEFPENVWTNNPRVTEVFNKLVNLPEADGNRWFRNKVDNLRTCSWNLEDFEDL